MSDSRIIYFFATPYRSLYKSLIFDCLCYPRGFIVQLVYDRRWLDEDLLNSDLQKLKNFPAMIIWVGKKSKSEHNINFQYYPIRKAIIKEIQSEGSYYYFYVLLEEWVDHWIDGEITNYHQCVSSSRYGHEYNNQGKLEGRTVVIEKINKNIKFTSNHLAWESTVKKLRELPEFENDLFFRINKFQEIPCKNPVRISGIDEFTNAYELTGGKHYNFEIIFSHGGYSSLKDPENNMKINSDEALVKMFPREIPLGFKAYKFNINLYTKINLINIPSEIVLNQYIKGNINQVIRVPIKIQRDYNYFIKYFLVLVFGWLLASNVISNFYEINTITEIDLILTGSFLSLWARLIDGYLQS